MNDKQYDSRNSMEMDKAGSYYIRHVFAMTKESLHNKSDIAAELAWRDMEIDRLKAALAAAPDQPTHHPETGEPYGTPEQEATAWRLKAENLERENALIEEINTQLCEQNTGVDAQCGKLERENVALQEALDAASSGLKWYRDTYADAGSGADDEMQEEIDATLAAAPAQHRPIIRFRHGCEFCGKLNGCKHVSTQPTHHPVTGEPYGTDAQEATAWRLKAENLDRELEELADINAQLEHWKVQLEEERAKLDRENVALNNALYDIYYEVKQGALPNPDDPWWGEAKAALAGTAQALSKEYAEQLEHLCDAIKAEDDYCVEHGDYMLDSDDCIKIVRGEWVRPDYLVDAARKQGANHE